MNRRLKAFLILWSFIILAYAFAITQFNQWGLRSLHDVVLPLQYIGSFIGVYHDDALDDEVAQTRQRISSTLSAFLSWKLQGGTRDPESYWIRLDDPRTQIDLYSPVWTFAGEVSSGANALTVVHHHEGREKQRRRDIELDNDLRWSWTVDL